MKYDVLIIGYGPVGAMTALSLAKAGMRVLIVDRSTEPADLPRAVGLDGESLRAFQRLGYADVISNLCQPPREPNEIGFANSRLETLFSLDVPAFGPNGWCDIVFFDQPELEVELRRIVEQESLIDVRLGEEVVALSQNDDGIRVRTRPSGTQSETEYEGHFAVGCDGASSFVRRAIGVGWESLDYDQDWLVIDVIQGPNANLPFTTMQICDPARLATYICVKDPNRRWEFQLLEGETREEMLEPDKIRELLDPWTASENYEIRRAAVYQFHAATADAWRKGRIFLAGDAAHQTPPFLGQGLNAGFRDAVNLGWKIPLVLGGICDQRLLDTYAEERDAHARDLVKRAVSIGKLMEVLAAREAGQPDPHPPESIEINVGGSFVPPMRGGALIAEQFEGDRSVGELLRQPIVRGQDGADQRLDEFLGDGFCLIGRKASDVALGPEASTVFDRLGGRTFVLEGIDLMAGERDALFDASPAAVIRPDRYVFGVVDDECTVDRLVLELGTKVSLRE